MTRSHDVISFVADAQAAPVPIVTSDHSAGAPARALSGSDGPAVSALVYKRDFASLESRGVFNKVVKSIKSIKDCFKCRLAKDAPEKFDYELLSKQFDELTRSEYLFWVKTATRASLTPHMCFLILQSLYNFGAQTGSSPGRTASVSAYKHGPWTS